MALDLVSIFALIAILVSIGVAWSGRFLASGSLVIGNLAVFGLTIFGPHTRYWLGANFRDVPVIHEQLALDSSLLWAGDPQAYLQLLTSMFVHADFFHILGNVVTLLFFALPFEERIGHKKFVALYLLSGLAATFAQLAFSWGGDMRLMGASGALFGVIGAFAASYPRQVIVVPIPVIIIFFARLRVLTAAMVFLGLQLLYLAFLSPFDNVAYWAHLGGLAAGALLAGLLIRVTPEKRVVVDATFLGEFAHTLSSREALGHMESNRDEPAIWQAWLERFFKSATCPTCQSAVRPEPGGKVRCEKGHQFDVRTT